RDVYATHVAVNVARLVTVAKLHLIKLTIGVHVQWDAGDAAGVLIGLIIHVFGADACRRCNTLSAGVLLFLKGGLRRRFSRRGRFRL
ncbi:MAG: hypothetical protein ACKPKO_51840, partial [Candidatus Fonsibacter sp.]